MYELQVRWLWESWDEEKDIARFLRKQDYDAEVDPRADARLVYFKYRNREAAQKAATRVKKRFGDELIGLRTKLLRMSG